MTNIKIIDTHAHIYSEQLMATIEDVIHRGKDNGVYKVFMPNVDSSSIDVMLEVEERFDHCYAMMGLHPCSVGLEVKEELAIVKKWMEKRPFCAVGEIGIDLYWDKTYYADQRYAFDYQIDMALANDLPIVIHSRDSLDITIDMVAKKQNGSLSGVFHCFSGTTDQVQRVVDLGFYMGIGGVATYKKAGLAELLPHIPLQHMVLETDAPYLPPVPHRGKNNEPSYLTYILTQIATVVGLPIEQIAEITTKNALNLFKQS